MFVLILTLIAILFILVFFLFFSLIKLKKGEFKKIKVSEIEIVKGNGLPSMIIFSDEIPEPMVDGKKYPKELRTFKEKPSGGIIYYNNNGDEMGGFVFGGRMEGEKPNQWVIFTFDAYKQNEIFQFTITQSGEKKTFEINFFSQPDKSLLPVIERMKDIVKIRDKEEKNEALKKLKEWMDAEYPDAYKNLIEISYDNGKGKIEINDKNGNPRIKIFIDENNNPKIEMITEDLHRN